MVLLIKKIKEMDNNLLIWYNYLRANNGYLSVLNEVINIIKLTKHSDDGGEYLLLNNPSNAKDKNPTAWNQLLYIIVPLNVDDRVINVLKEATNGKFKDFVIYPTSDGKVFLHYECQ